LIIARKKFPGAKASLDALCGRYGISLDKRDKHGALLDSELLADVYIELLGGAQDSLSLSKQEKEPEKKLHMKSQIDFPMRSYPVTEDEKKAHDSFLEKIKDPLWTKL
jgi:DNA polymerase-3 subunit epsilon